MPSETSDQLSRWESDPYVTAWPEMRPFWAAAAEGRFLMPQCQECVRCHWHPRAVCPFCHSVRLTWIEASGLGTIFSYSIARTWSPPHVVAFVKTLEGPVILTQIVDSHVSDLQIGATVRAKMIPVKDGRSLPYFALEGEDSSYGIDDVLTHVPPP